MDDGFATGFLAGQDSGGGGNGGGGGWGGFGEGIWAVIILAILFGWGRGGGGAFGGGSGGGGGGDGVAAGFAWQGIDNGIRGIQQGLCDGFYAVNTGLLNGFHGVDNAICNLGYQLKDCCCQTQRAIDGVNYNLATGFCNLGNTINGAARDIIDNQNANYRGIMDFMVQTKIDALQNENDALRLRASQADQNAVIRAAIDASTAEIIRRTGNDYPSAAFLVQPPTPVNFPVNGCGTVQFGGCGNYGNNCGCGCGCG